MAQEWDSGVLPYRDIRSYNFPGHIYLHWILGKLFGWDHIERLLRCRRHGSPAPGSYRHRVEPAPSGPITSGYRRLSHFPGVLSGRLLRQRGPTGLALAPVRDPRAPPARDLARPAHPMALCTLAAMAFTIRPQVVLFLPALLVAAVSGDVATRGTSSADDARITFKQAILPALEWICAFAVFVAVGFAPLLLSGLLDDLGRGLGILRRGGPYGDATITRSLRILWDEVRQPKISALGIGLLLLSMSRDRDLKVMARTWLLALLGVLVYRPIHPVDHGYLKTPLALVGAVSWAIPIAWIVRATTAQRRIGGPTLFAGVLAIVLIVYESIPTQFPGNCSLRTSIDSILAAPTGGRPEMPPGEWIWYRRERSYYSWDGYCRLLEYIREKTGPRTIVANVLKNPPLPCGQRCNREAIPLPSRIGCRPDVGGRRGSRRVIRTRARTSGMRLGRRLGARGNRRTAPAAAEASHVGHHRPICARGPLRQD